MIALCAYVRCLIILYNTYSYKWLLLIQSAAKLVTPHARTHTRAHTHTHTHVCLSVCMQVIAVFSETFAVNKVTKPAKFTIQKVSPHSYSVRQFCCVP